VPIFESVYINSFSLYLNFIGKHRKHPGGRGLAGGLHHHRTNMDKYHPGYYGKVGMRHFHLTKQGYHRPVVNLDKLWTLVSEQTRKKYAIQKDVAPVIDTLRAVSRRQRYLKKKKLFF
jgi:large subunit ribosomal protein L27Ae